MRALGQFIRLLLVNAFLMAVILFFALGLLTDKFPPDLASVRTTLLRYRIAQTQTAAQAENVESASATDGPAPESGGDVALLKLRVFTLQTRVDRLEKENREIRERLNARH